MKKLLHGAIILLLICAAGILFVIYRARQKPPMDRAVIAHQPGSILSLSRGLTYYEDHGPSQGPVVLLLHGSIYYSIVWEKNIPALTAQGYRVIVFDQYGRGFSQRPVDTRYTIRLFSEQTRELLDSLDIYEPVHLAGISLGGAIAVSFAQEYPRRTASVSLFAPAGPRSMERSPLEAISRMSRRLLKQVTDHSGDAQKREERLAPLRRKMKKQFKYYGFEQAVLSALRNRDAVNLKKMYRTFADLTIPTLLVWGEDDSVLPISRSEEITALLPRVSFHRIPDAGHSTVYEKPTAVNRILTDFLRGIAPVPHTPKAEQHRPVES
ncbi:MAG: alpha/beta fold hydrolase [Fibrobacterota bacterium]